MEWVSSLFLINYGKEAERNILRQHMHKREFWILTNRCGNDVKYENKAEGRWPLSLVFVFKIIFTFLSQNPKFFFMHVL